MKKNIWSVFLIGLTFYTCSGDGILNETENNDLVIETIEDPNAPSIKNEWEAWIKKQSHRIESPEVEDLTDYSFLKQIITNRRIIQLGESSHGSREYSQSKTRMIKYLHQELGFNILSMEFSSFNCFDAMENEILNGSMTILENCFPPTSQTKEIAELVEYVVSTQSTNNPLYIVGFDIIPSANSAKKRPYFLKEIFNHIDVQEADKIFELDNYMNEFIFYYDTENSDFNEEKDSLKIEYQKYLSLLEENWEELITKYSSNPLYPYLAKMTLQSMIGFIDFKYYSIKNKKLSREIRDEYLFNNFDKLFSEIYPGKKFIIWAHNLHIRHNNESIYSLVDSGSKTMGSYTIAKYRDQLYTIGFYVYKGKMAKNNGDPRKIYPANSNNIEAVLYYARKNYLFVDMLFQEYEEGNSWMFEEMSAKYWGKTEQLMFPREQYDAIFYVHESKVPQFINF